MLLVLFGQLLRFVFLFGLRYQQMFSYCYSGNLDCLWKGFLLDVIFTVFIVISSSFTRSLIVDAIQPILHLWVCIVVESIVWVWYV